MHQIRFVLLSAAGLIALPLLQLIPMPPELWTLLPGRAAITNGFAAANMTPPWLPVSLSPAETWRSALSLLPPAAILVSALSLNQGSRRALTLALISLGFVSVVVGLAQIAGGPDGPFRLYGESTTADGFFLSRNHYAAFLYSTVPFTAAWAVGLAADRRPEARVGIALCLVVFASLLLGLGMAQSRAGLALAIAAALASMLLARPLTETKSVSWIRWLILAAALISLLLTIQFAFSGLSQRLETDPLADDRWTFAGVTFRAALIYFPVGSGFGTFDSIYMMYENLGMLEPTYVNNAHNDFLEVFLEGGLASVVLFVGFLVWLILSTRRTWRKTKNEDSILDVSISRAAVIPISLLLIHSAFDYPLRSSALACVFALCCALMLPPTGTSGIRSATGSASGKKKTRSIPRLSI